jgi:hypothetical protein
MNFIKYSAKNIRIAKIIATLTNFLTIEIINRKINAITMN